MINTNKYRDILETRMQELQSRLEEIDSTLDSADTRDWEELATERESDEVLETMGLQGQAEINAIEAALARMDTGEYGYCVRCGEEIAEERLDLVPYTPFCRECAGKQG